MGNFKEYGNRPSIVKRKIERRQDSGTEMLSLFEMATQLHFNFIDSIRGLRIEECAP